MIELNQVVVEDYDISMQVTITGNKYPSSIANALRRAIEEEIPTVQITYVRFLRMVSSTSEEHLVLRLGQLPILQNGKLSNNSSVRIDWKNKTTDVMYITSDDIEGIDFVDTHPILALAPGEEIFADVFVTQNMGRRVKNFSPFSSVGFDELGNGLYQFNIRHKKMFPNEMFQDVLGYAIKIVNENPESLRSNSDRLHRLIIFHDGDKGKRVQCTTVR